MNLSQVILRPVTTEKTHRQANYNVVAFEVDVRASKEQIKQAIEQFFKVKVSRVRTTTKKGESRKTGRRRLPHDTTPVKKALVQLVEGERISMFEGAVE